MGAFEDTHRGLASSPGLIPGTSLPPPRKGVRLETYSKSSSCFVSVRSIILKRSKGKHV